MTPRRKKQSGYCVALVAEAPLRDTPTRIADSPLTWVIAAIVLSVILLAASSVWAADTAPAAATVVPPAESQAKEMAASPAANVASGEAAPSAWPPGLLMDSLGSARKPLDDLGIRTYGFFDTGITSNLNGEKVPFGRVFDARRMDQWRFNQLALNIDRPYDSSKQVDWGFRLEGTFGGDSMFTHAAGLFDHAGVSHTDAWADLVQAYAHLWLKTGTDSGLETMVGKFVSPMGAEVIDAPGNQLYSHSYLFGYAVPFTNTGVKETYYFNKQFSAYIGAVEGWDEFQPRNDGWSEIGGLALAGAEQLDNHPRDQFYFNLITGPEEQGDAHDNRTVLDFVLTHYWTSPLSSTINADWGEEQGISPTGGSNHWYGVAHYLTYVINDYVSATWRTEWFRDQTGSRIGVPGNFAENTLGLNITPRPADKIWKNLSIRPEIRWDNSDQRVFEHGTEQNGVTAAVDIIFKF
jgi:hypothetical protein